MTRPNTHLGLKLRYVLEPDRWEKRGIAEKLVRTLAGKKGGSARDVDSDYAAGLAQYRAVRPDCPSDIEALRRVQAVTPLVGPDTNGRLREGADRDVALRKWLDRAVHWEMYAANDARWYGMLKRLLRHPPKPLR